MVSVRPGRAQQQQVTSDARSRFGVPTPRFQRQAGVSQYPAGNPGGAANTSAQDSWRNRPTASNPLGGSTATDADVARATQGLQNHFTSPGAPAPSGSGNQEVDGIRYVGYGPGGLSEPNPNYPGNANQTHGPVDRGGQHANLSRYMPPLIGRDGQAINPGTGGYSYNLPNAFGPYPGYNDFGREQGSLPMPDFVNRGGSGGVLASVMDRIFGSGQGGGDGGASYDASKPSAEYDPSLYKGPNDAQMPPGASKPGLSGMRSAAMDPIEDQQPPPYTPQPPVVDPHGSQGNTSTNFNDYVGPQFRGPSTIGFGRSAPANSGPGNRNFRIGGSMDRSGRSLLGAWRRR